MSEEASAEKSQLRIKLVVRGKSFEISTEGTLSSIYKELDALSEFANQVAERLEIMAEVPEAELEVVPSAEEIAVIPTADLPVIKASPKTMENLESLFDTPWGRTPRSLVEVMKALEVNAVPDNVSTVAVYLRRLVRRGKLRRIEKEGKWSYFKIPSEE